MGMEEFDMYTTGPFRLPSYCSQDGVDLTDPEDPWRNNPDNDFPNVFVFIPLRTKKVKKKTSRGHTLRQKPLQTMEPIPEPSSADEAV
jgi:hypothetical protein